MSTEALGRGIAHGGRWSAWASRAPAMAAQTRAHPITRWGFYLYVFSIPLEYPDRTLPFDYATLMGGVFLLAAAFSPRVCFGRMSVPVAWYWAFLYVWIGAFALNGGHYPDLVLQAFLRLLQLVLILWASINLMRDERTRQATLLALSLSCLILAALQVTEVANAPADFGGGLQRATVLGQNPNRTGRFLAGAALVLVGLSYGRARSILGPRWLAWPLLGLLALAMVQGGSRGAMLSLAIGMFTFTLAGGTLGTKIRNSLVATLVVGVLAWIAIQSPLMQKRFEQAESGNLAGREEIFPTAFEMFRERPLVGWGPIRTYFELASRLPEHGSERRDTHNLVLELLTSTGALGTTFCLTAVALCVLAAWRARRGPEGVLPLALMTLVLIGNMSGNFLVFKLYWIYQAYAVGSALALRDGARESPSHRLARRARAGGNIES
ncbi:MAG: O-antigen ligase family protein [Gemmatimonadetes bacterium]|nr:O-antigen ligase family protein [Gemmatimonadota bacterium]